MATGILDNNPIIFGKQNNTITLDTENTFIINDINIDFKVTTAVLTTAAATNSFDITVPNGASTVTFNFAVDSNGNVLVT